MRLATGLSKRTGKRTCVAESLVAKYSRQLLWHRAEDFGSATTSAAIRGYKRVRRETGKEQVVKVHYDEGVAIRIGPEPCAGAREGIGEASAGVCAGQPSSRERPSSRAPTPFSWRKAIRTGASTRVPGRPGVVGDPGMRRRFLYGNREISRSASSNGAACCPGPHREGEEP